MAGNAKTRTTQLLPEKSAKIVGKLQPWVKAAGIGLFKFSCLVRPTRSFATQNPDKEENAKS